MNRNEYDLTNGGILSKLLLVALPAMGTQFMQMAYNLTDMFWLGRIGSDAVAASGTVGMYLWLSMAFLFLGRMGAEIGVSQNLGQGAAGTAKDFAHTSLWLAAVLGIAYAVIMALFREPLIGFLGIREARVVADAEIYLLLVAPGIPFAFITGALTGVFSGSGNARLPFYINALGLVMNMILDPVLIFSAGLGIAGAAIATLLAQAVVAVLLALGMKYAKSRPFSEFLFFQKPLLYPIPAIFKWGVPVALENLFFTFLSMLLSRMVAVFGAGALAVSRVGSQIESLSWLISGGYSSALTAFIGQNYGAGKWSRIRKGYRLSAGAMSVWGIAVTALLFFGARGLFAAFLPQPEIVEMGVVYLQILSICQIVMCLEFTTAGCFRGMGKTLPPSVASITCNAARVLLAYFLTGRLGLNGVWWALTIGGSARGIWILIWYYAYNRNLPKTDISTGAA